MIVLLFAGSSGKAMADGFSAHQISSPPIGDRKPALFVKLDPPVLLEGRSDTSMLLRFFDEKTNQTIAHASYLIQVTKDGRQYPLGTFHTHTGILVIKVQPSPGPVTVYANTDPFLPETWIADPNGVVNVKGPLLLESGLYGIHVEVPGIDNDGYLFDEPTRPKFDTGLSVGDISYHDMDYAGKKYNATIVSYYDSVSDFGFNQEQKAITWKMPFDWNTTRISSNNNILVHEEVRLAAPLYSGLAGNGTLKGTVNGLSLDGSRILVDPFSFPGSMALHYSLTKSDLVELSRKIPQGTGEMQFAMTPDIKTIGTSGRMIAVTGGMEVLVSWSPGNLEGNADSTATLRFIDAASGSPVAADVNYDMAIYKDGKPVLERKDLVATGGADSQTVSFPADDVYSIEVKVKGLVRDGLTPDLTRNGVATGTVVVPEFPLSALVAAASIALAVVLLRARRWNMDN